MSTALSACLLITSFNICQSMEIKAGGNDASLFISPTGMVRADAQPGKAGDHSESPTGLVRADVQPGQAGEHSESPKNIISEPSLGNSPARHDPLSEPERKVSADKKTLPGQAQLRKETLSGHPKVDPKLQEAEAKQDRGNRFWHPVWDETPTHAPLAKPSLFGRRNQVMAGFVFITILNVGLLGAGVMACIMVKKRGAKTLQVPCSPAADASADADAEASAKADADTDGVASDAGSSFAVSSFAASSTGPLLSSAFTGAGGALSGPASLVLDPDICPGCGADYAPSAANCRKCGMPREEVQVTD